MLPIVTNRSIGSWTKLVRVVAYTLRFIQNIAEGKGNIAEIEFSKLLLNPQVEQFHGLDNLHGGTQP